MSSDTLVRPFTGRRSCLVSAGLAFVTYFGVRLLLESTALAGPLRIDAVGVKTAERRYR